METFSMSTTNLNIRTEKAVKDQLDTRNDTTSEVIEEGRKLMEDPYTPRYSSIAELKAALEVCDMMYSLLTSSKKI